MTDRLYYNDSYLTEFTACVLAAFPLKDGKSLVYLDRSAFYPTSGGQPFDTGFLGGHSVIDVYVDENNDVAHIIEGTLQTGETIKGRIDWPRRFDHMQQHAGEHMLAGCVHRMFNGYTVGLHLGHADSSIDVELPNGRMHLSEEGLLQLEDEVNSHIYADEPIHCYFPGDSEIVKIPLRKVPAVQKHIRVVQIGDWEYCACGGTHPSSTGQIGLLKIIDARPSKGKLRLTFLCGNRAYLHYRKCLKTVRQLCAILSSEEENLPAAAREQTEKYKNAVYELNRQKVDRAMEKVRMLAEGIKSDSTVPHIIKCVFDDARTEGLKKAADYLCTFPGFVALLGSRSAEGVSLLFSKNASISLDIGKLLSSLVKQYGGKGGGNSDFARGFANDPAILDAAEEMINSIRS